MGYENEQLTGKQEGQRPVFREGLQAEMTQRSWKWEMGGEKSGKSTVDAVG
jgi:hypothetical protein